MTSNEKLPNEKLLNESAPRKDQLEIETWLADDIDEPLARQIGQLLCTVWPKPGRTVETRVKEMREQRGKHQGNKQQAPRSFLIREHGNLIAHAAILPRLIRTSAGEMVVAGLARVCTDPAQRGRGLGEKIVRAALGPVDAGLFPVMLFQTTPDVQPFYEKLGARVVENRFVNSLADDPEANPFWNTVSMIYPKQAEWPEGVIDLLGPGY